MVKRSARMPKTNPKTKPNILILHTDQQRHDSLGCAGNPFAVTPNIDSLAADGTVFSRHIVSNTVCMPSRASLLTGLYPPGHNVWSNGVALPRRNHAPGLCDIYRNTGEESVFSQIPTIADVFASAGYNTAAFGKLHLTPFRSEGSTGFGESWDVWEAGDLDDWYGPYYGFQHVEIVSGHGDGSKCSAGHYGKWMRQEHPDLVEQIKKGGSESRHPDLKAYGLNPSSIPHALHNSSWIASRFDSFLDEKKAAAKPFMAFVGFPEPHHPFAPSFDIVDEFEGSDVKEPVDPECAAAQSSSIISRFVRDTPGLSINELSQEQRRQFIRYTQAMIYQIDCAVGSIIQTLKEKELWDNTVIVFTSDHGDFLGDHALLRKDMMASDPLLRVPFILRAPGIGLPPAVSTPMSNCDVLPTLMKIAGIEGAIGASLHGKDIVEIARNNSDHLALAFCYNAINNNANRRLDNFTAYTRNLRFTLYPDLGVSELYDHQVDPAEITNLSGNAAYSETVAELTRVICEKNLSYSLPLLNRMAPY
jgi:arylsulfatase A-like enzyme